MSFIISDWNLNPNITWYIKISDIGSEMQVDLYESQADAVAETNLIASVSVSFGTNKSIILIDSSGYGITYFNSALSYHLKVSGIDSDPTVIFEVAPFIDLPDINNGIYTSEALIQKKAINEINKHTHIFKNRAISIANHVPTLQCGDVVRLNSTRRGIDVLTTLEEFTIIGTADSLINQIDTVENTDLNYG